MNCKPGDMAIVVQSDFPEDIGMIIEVLSESHIDWEGCYQWLTKWPSPSPTCSVETGEIVLRSETFVPDEWLRPVSGIPITDDVTDEVVA